ncbi:MAG: phage major capsid protein [Deltaproteobacteria bacterium]|nr:phage major capsid protein [Deltaproteobacteria bacterium]
MDKLKQIIEDLGVSFEEFKAKNDGRIDKLETILGRGAFGGGDAKRNPPGTSQVAIDIDGRKIPVFAKGEKMSDLFPTPSSEVEDEAFSLGNFLKASMGLEVKASVLERGTASVPAYLSAQIIDAIRAKSRLMQAGTLTIPIEGKTTICRIASDPTVVEHTEAANDITESVPVLEPVDLDPKMLAALIPLSVEIVQDSPNLDAALQMSLAAAFASKLDALGVATILADSDIPTSETTEATATWAGILAATGSMLAADQDLPKALICSPGDFTARASQAADSSGVWLGAPPVLANMLDLPTTGMSDSTGIMGDFATGFGVASRMDMQLELIRWGKPGYGTHLLVAWARMAGYVLQPKALYLPAVVA